MRLFFMSLVPAFLTICTLPAQAAETLPLLRSRAATANGATPADSPPEAEANTEPGEYKHRGIHFRGELGGGYRSLSTDVEGHTVTVDGGGVGANLIGGGAVASNLIFVGELSINNIVNPTIHLDDMSAETKKSSATLIGFGPGFIYYLMPVNVSFGASLLLTRMSITKDGETLGRTDWGFGGALRLGKEWQVAKQLGLGLGAQFAFASMKDQGEGAPTWLVKTFSLGVTLTRN